MAILNFLNFDALLGAWWVVELSEGFGRVQNALGDSLGAEQNSAEADN